MKANRVSGGTVAAWHFVGDTLRDGRPVPADGRLLRFDGGPILCKSGLHASRVPSDALRYAPGPILCLVALGGTIVDGGDKLAATERTIMKRIDATDLLRYFARMQAVSVLHLWNDNPPDVVLDYLMTGDDSMRVKVLAAAEAVTWTARTAARAAARAAAEDAARAAAEAAVWTARTAAWTSAQSSAWADFNALVDETFFS